MRRTCWMLLSVLLLAARMVAAAETTVEAARARIGKARKEIASLKPEERQHAWWRVAAAEQLLAQGHAEESLEAAGGPSSMVPRPPGLAVVQAGDLGLVVRRTEEGVDTLSLSDAAAQRELLTPQNLPLFALTLRHAMSKQEVRLSAESGWKSVGVTSLAEPPGLEIRWRQPADEKLGDLQVVARATADSPTGAIRWKLDVENKSKDWSVWHVVFPQAALAELDPQGEVFFPRGCGEVQRGVWRRAFRYQGTYPSGWTAMQLLAAYEPQHRTGLYFAVHDPRGGTKDILVESRPNDKSLVLSFDHPAADMGKAGNSFTMSGQAVWQVLRGDWFDAAVIYRDWVRREAEWYPKLGAEGREETPLWMRELPVWVMTGGAPADCMPKVEAFAKTLGVPVGFHWYNWHQIPFDNDYPHYFPPKDGFADGVAKLQAAGVYVMPYINGRLWDTHDKGAEDFEFGRIARAAATKDEKGQPCVETYGSKEKDGSPVRLAAMCPATALWQGRVREIVLRLMNECGVKGVYIDQIAAAAPRLCFDAAHGHPLGGGHWWTAAYWQLVGAIRQQMPKDRMITTECNAEPYIKWFDGYLTWHWQYDGQVPAFPAIYGGAIQMFGRAYRGGDTKDLALRMKAGQQLVYGEQIGWFDPGVIQDKANLDFLRQAVRLRWQFRRYFYAGEMARPPKLQGEIPSVKADWQWSGVWWVTTDAVMTGAWRLPAENKVLLLMVNVGDQQVTAALDIDASRYGLPGEQVRAAVIGPDGPGETLTLPRAFRRDVTLPPRSARAWELTASR